jgi:hypothetical protein
MYVGTKRIIMYKGNTINFGITNILKLLVYLRAIVCSSSKKGTIIKE